MRNFIQKGDTITVASPGNIDGGDAVVISGLIGVAAGDAATGKDLDLVTRGVFELAKVESDAFTVGASVYLVGGTAGALVTTSSGGNTLIGVAVSVAGNPSATVHVKIG